MDVQELISGLDAVGKDGDTYKDIEADKASGISVTEDGDGATIKVATLIKDEEGEIIINSVSDHAAALGKVSSAAGDIYDITEIDSGVKGDVMFTVFSVKAKEGGEDTDTEEPEDEESEEDEVDTDVQDDEGETDTDDIDLSMEDIPMEARRKKKAKKKSKGKKDDKDDKKKKKKDESITEDKTQINCPECGKLHEIDNKSDYGVPFWKAKETGYCPDCAKKIAEKDAELEKAKEEEGKVGDTKKESTKSEAWENLPKGWTKDSLDKFAQSLTGKTKSDPNMFVRMCVSKIGKTGMSDPAAFCASLKDQYVGSKGWRGKSAESAESVLPDRIDHIMEDHVGVPRTPEVIPVKITPEIVESMKKINYSSLIDEIFNRYDKKVSLNLLTGVDAIILESDPITETLTEIQGKVSDVRIHSLGTVVENTVEFPIALAYDLNGSDDYGYIDMFTAKYDLLSNRWSFCK